MAIGPVIVSISAIEQSNNHWPLHRSYFAHRFYQHRYPVYLHSQRLSHHWFQFGHGFHHHGSYNNGFGLSDRYGQFLGHRSAQHHGYSVYLNSQRRNDQLYFDRRSHHAYPVVLFRGNYYGTNNGRGYQKVVFSNGQFWWTNNEGYRVVMHVRRFNGYPVVQSNGHYWGTDNGHDYFAVDLENGHYYRIQHLHFSMRLHLGDVRRGRQFQDHAW